MRETLDPMHLTEIVRTKLAGADTQLRLRPVETGKHNTSFWVEGEEQRWVLRVAPPDDTGFLWYERLMMRQEPELHEMIRERTTLPVAKIVVADFSRSLLDRDFVVLDALPGEPMSARTKSNPAHTAQTLYQVGRHLRQLHTLTAPDCLGLNAYGYLGAHHPMDAQPTWLDAFRLMWNSLLDDVVACGCYSLAEAQVLRDLFAHHQAAFGHEVAPCLLHMDVWSQNILVDQSGNVTGLVDFDRALWGDPEIEFAVLDYCGISEPSFWEGYGIQRDESTAATVRRRFYLLYEVQKYMPIHIWRGDDPAGAQACKEQCLQLAAPLG